VYTDSRAVAQMEIAADDEWSFQMRRKILVAITGLVLFAMTPAFAAETHTLKAQIPFQFTAGSKLLPAGEYEFRIDYATSTVSVHSSSKGGETFVPFITTLAAAQHSTATDAHIVFDKVGDAYTLSELCEPDAQGVLVYATKGKHEHHVIHVPR
jgi:hypothetical protein